MKTTSTLIILFLAIAFVSCQKDIEESNTNGIIVTNGQIQSPEWLIHTVDSVAHLYNPSPGTNRHPYPWVYSVSHKNQKYILVNNMLSSCLTCGKLFFTISGDPIYAPENLDTGLYWDLFNEQNRTLIWQE